MYQKHIWFLIGVPLVFMVAACDSLFTPEPDDTKTDTQDTSNTPSCRYIPSFFDEEYRFTWSDEGRRSFAISGFDSRLWVSYWLWASAEDTDTQSDRVRIFADNVPTHDVYTPFQEGTRMIADHNQVWVDFYFEKDTLVPDHMIISQDDTVLKTGSILYDDTRETFTFKMSDGNTYTIYFEKTYFTQDCLLRPHSIKMRTHDNTFSYVRCTESQNRRDQIATITIWMLSRMSQTYGTGVLSLPEFFCLLGRFDRA